MHAESTALVGTSQRQDAHGLEIIRSAEMAANATAAQAEALVKARFSMAVMRPRDFDQSRDRLLRACKRPRAAASFRYRVPRAGGHIEGLSIRFAECAMRALGNIEATVTTLFDDDSRRVIRCTAVDLETNASHSKDVTISKRVERRRLRRGQVAISERANSDGEVIFTVQATDDEVAQKEGALGSKALRTCILRLIDDDLLEEAEEAIRATVRGDIQKDPDAAKRKILDAFSQDLNVKPAAIARFLGHPVDTISEAEIIDLRGVYRAIRDGNTTWNEALAEVEAARGRSGDEPDAAPLDLDELKAGTADADEKPAKDSKAKGAKASKKDAPEAGLDGLMAGEDMT